MIEQINQVIETKFKEEYLELIFQDALEVSEVVIKLKDKLMVDLSVEITQFIVDL